MTYEGYQDYFDKKLIISVATTGGHQGKEANPNLPEQPEEIAEDVRRCEEAGAAIVHLHARDEDGEPTKDVSRFQMLRDHIDEKCDDIVVNFTTGGGGIHTSLEEPEPDLVFSAEERIQPILETSPPPEVATVDIGPLNTGQTRTAVNPREQNEHFVRRMRDSNVKPEFEIFSQGHVPEMRYLIDQELVDPPYWCSLIFGMQTSTPPHPRNLINMLDNLPEQVEWQTLATGRHQLPMTTMSIIMGGHVRVGMEDNVYYRKGELAESNAQLVRRTARVAKELERPLASPAEAREILGL